MGLLTSQSKMKKTMKKITILSSTILMSLTSTGCVPVAVVGGGALIGTSIMEERGVGGVVTDGEIATKLQAALAKLGVDAYTNVSYKVREGRVLLTGNIKDNEQHIKVITTVWQVRGVQEVIDELREGVDKNSGLKQSANDSWITTQLKTQMVMEKGVRSINYSVVTYQGVVYLMGYARNQEEIERIRALAQEVPGVKQFVNYARLCE